MSYASGFMVGTSIGKAVYDMFHNKKGEAAAAAAPAGVCRSQVQAAKPAAAVPRFACVSVLKGRRRYRAAALVGNAELAKLIEEKVSTLPDVQFVQVSAVTGSILVFAHSEGTLDKLENFFRFRLFPNAVEGLVGAVCDAGQAEAGKAESATYLKAVQDTADVFSQAIFRKSKAFMDLRTLIAVVLTLRGLRKTVFLGQRPTGPQMLWWALSLLRRR
ncbi:HMA2 domain-containing protein [Megasphaera elsdenii]|uniref:HMA2 domain-containing protein n=1 Tax=Megasphaera elsdenii TaxID=907 RepID=UPI0033942B3B